MLINLSNYDVEGRRLSWLLRFPTDNLEENEINILTAIRRKNKLRFFGSKDFNKPNAFNKVFGEKLDLDYEHTSTVWNQVLAQSVLNWEVSTNTSGERKLTPREELTLFERFNYCRWKVAQYIYRTNDKRLSTTETRQMLQWWNKAEEQKKIISVFNMGLIFYVSKKIVAFHVEKSDLLSIGFSKLHDAVDCFNTEKGFKFSTYCFYILKRMMIRESQKQTQYRLRLGSEIDETRPIEDMGNIRFGKRTSNFEQQDSKLILTEMKDVLAENTADLNEYEMEIIKYRFFYNPPLTLKAIGKLMNVTKERIRQTEEMALNKLRSTLEGNPTKPQAEELIYA